MVKIVQFLVVYSQILYLAMFGILAVVALVNFISNPYAKQNGKLNKFRKRVTAHPTKIVKCVKILPQEYQRQWRAYVNSGAQKPSVVFEFVKKSNKYKLWFLHLLSTLLSIAYLFLSLAWKIGGNMFSVQMVFVLASVLVILLKKLIDHLNLTIARKCFGKFVNTLNRVAVRATPPNQQELQTTVEQLNQLKNTDQNSLVDKTIKILQQKGLDNPRTVDEQRKLNLALNGLLQTCCRKRR